MRLRGFFFAVIATGVVAILIVSLEGEPAGARGPQKQKGDWTPPNVDAPLAIAASSAPCPLPDVLKLAGERAREMVDNLQSFTAREEVRYEQLDNLGLPLGEDHAQFEYAVGFEQASGGLKVTEARSGNPESDSLAAAFQDSGLPAIALIFHPYYQDDYEMACEGAVEASGEQAWVVHFQQRKDKRSRTRSFRTDKGSYPARLKGRAWIAANSHQVVHIETNLITAIPMIHLKSDAVRVDYAPVQFASKSLTLWLPRSSESYSDLEKYKLVVKRSFSNYLLSSVRTEQVIDAPKN